MFTELTLFTVESAGLTSRVTNAMFVAFLRLISVNTVALSLNVAVTEGELSLGSEDHVLLDVGRKLSVLFELLEALMSAMYLLLRMPSTTFSQIFFVVNVVGIVVAPGVPDVPAVDDAVVATVGTVVVLGLKQPLRDSLVATGSSSSSLIRVTLSDVMLSSSGNFRGRSDAL